MKKKVFIVYRVIQHWRAPVFEKIALSNKYRLKVLHGPNFIGTKIVSSNSEFEFDKKKLISFKMQFKSANGIIAMPFSPFLFFRLCINQPDVIISEGASNLINAFQSFCYCKIFRKKFIWWSLGKIQNRDYDIKRKKIDNLIKYIEKKSDAIISYSTMGKKYFSSSGIPDNKIFVAVNVIDTSSKLNHLKNLDILNIQNEFHQNTSFNVLFVGSINKEKNIEILIKAFHKLEKKYSDAGLIIVGDGSHLKALKELSDSLKIKNIKFPGNVEEGVERYFIGADVFVLPGLGGLAVSEAMVYALPVIASIGDGCEADLIDKTNGFLDPDLNEVSLFEYLEILYLDRNMLNRLKICSQKKIFDKYNIENYLDQVYKAIEY